MPISCGICARRARAHSGARCARWSGRSREILKKSGANLAAVDFFIVPTDRGWIRDFGPIFVRDADGDTGITNWRFNGWAKYDDWKSDDAATAKLSPRLETGLRGRRYITSAALCLKAAASM